MIKSFNTSLEEEKEEDPNNNSISINNKVLLDNKMKIVNNFNDNIIYLS